MKFGDRQEQKRLEVNFWKMALTGTYRGLVLAAACSCAIGQTTADHNLNKTEPTRSLRPFTVAASIEATHLDVPDENSADRPPVSPNGKKFLVVTEKGVIAKNVRSYALHVYDLERFHTTPVLVAKFDSSSNRPGISAAKWVDDQHISMIAENPMENPQVYLVDWKTGSKKKLTDDPEGVVAYDISRDQKEIVYYANWAGDKEEIKYKEEHGFAVSDETLADLVSGNWRRPSMFVQMYIRDLMTGAVRVIHAAPFEMIPIRLHVWLSPDASYVITEQVADNIPDSWEAYDDPIVKRVASEVQGKIRKQRTWELSQLMIVDVRTRDIRPLIDAPSSIGSAVSVVWCADSKSAVVASTLLPLNVTDPLELAARRKHPVLAEVNVVSGSLRRIIEIPNDEWLTMKAGAVPDTFSIDGWQMEGGSFTSELGSRQFHRSGERWIEEKRAANNDPGWDIRVKQELNRRPILVKEVNHKEIVVLDPNPQFDQYRFQREEVIHWQGERGEALMGGLFYPADYTAGTRYPLVIQTHGFSPELFMPDGPFTTAFAAQELANKGVVVLQLGEGPLYRQSHGSPEFGPVLLSQLESGLDYLDGLGVIDRKRVGLVGFSMTGFQVIYALSHSKYPFAAATSAEGNDYGYWNYVREASSAAWVAQNDALYGGSPWKEGKDLWVKESISFNYDKIRTPLRLEAELNDNGIAVMNEWEPFIALKRLGKPVELLYVAHGEHPVVKPWDRIASQQGNVDWLLYWLKGEVDPEPSKAAQYQRWHELKKLLASQGQSE